MSTAAVDEALGLAYLPFGMGAIDQWGGELPVTTKRFASSVIALDLATGKIDYQRCNGTIRDEAPLPLPFKLGVPSLGGPMVTGGGVAFLGSALDYYLHAYDTTTGRVLWQARLPAGGQATPMTYLSPASGRQFVVVVAGGHATLGTRSGDSVIAYALPCKRT